MAQPRDGPVARHRAQPLPRRHRRRGRRLRRREEPLHSYAVYTSLASQDSRGQGTITM